MSDPFTVACHTRVAEGVQCSFECPANTLAFGHPECLFVHPPPPTVHGAALLSCQVSCRSCQAHATILSSAPLSASTPSNTILGLPPLGLPPRHESRLTCKRRWSHSPSDLSTKGGLLESPAQKKQQSPSSTQGHVTCPSMAGKESSPKESVRT